MCVIKTLAGTACGANPAGMKGIGYMIPAEELVSFPAFLTTTTAGDTVKLTGNFSLVTTSTLGYFRSFPVLINTGSYKTKAVGAVGSKSVEETYSFKVNGLGAAELEFYRNLLNIPGVWLCADKAGVVHVLGSKDDPAYLQEAEGGSGAATTDERAITFTITSTAASPAIYTGTINTTPAP